MAVTNIYSEVAGISAPLVDGVAIQNIKVYFEDNNVIFEIFNVDGETINRYSADASTFGGSIQSLKKFFPKWSIEVALNDKEII